MSTDKKRAKFFGQFRPLAGYLLACLTSGFVIGIGIAVLENISRTTPKPWNAARLFLDATALTLFTAPIVMMMTFLAVVPFVWWSENRPERRFVVHAVAGIAMATVVPISLFWLLGVRSFTFRNISEFFIAYGPAGFVAGATYWFVAGRRAGADGLSRNS